MPVPDEVAFAPKTDGKDVFYKTVRTCDDDTQRIKYVKARLDNFFIEHVEPLKKHNSAFPLALMTCIGIETLGEIFITPNNDKTNHQFVEIARKLDQKISRKFSQDFEKEFLFMWNESEKTKNVKNFAELLYSFFRNTMVHGYHAQGVFLSYDDIEDWELDNGFVKMNPNWFWEKFQKHYNKLFDEAINGEPNSTIRRNCLEYIEELIA